MPKLDYQPPQDSKNIELTRKEYEQSHGWKPRTPFQRRMARPFQPLAYAFKDLKNTFKPYKGWYQSNDDFIQPFNGVGHLFLSAIGATLTVLALAFSPFALLTAGGYLAYNFFFSKNQKESNQKLADHVLNYLEVGLYRWPMIAVSCALRGITQIASTPLTWLFKMPLRALITWFKGRPALEDSESVQRLTKMGKEVLTTLPENSEGMVNMNQTSMPAIMKALHVKLRHGIEKKNLTYLSCSQHEERYKTLTEIANASVYGSNPNKILWKPVSKNDLQNCLTLFSSKNNKTITNNEDEIKGYKV